MFIREVKAKVEEQLAKARDKNKSFEAKANINENQNRQKMNLAVTTRAIPSKSMYFLGETKSI